MRLTCGGSCRSGWCWRQGGGRSLEGENLPMWQGNCLLWLWVEWDANRRKGYWSGPGRSFPVNIFDALKVLKKQTKHLKVATTPFSIHTHYHSHWKYLFGSFLFWGFPNPCLPQIESAATCSCHQMVDKTLASTIVGPPFPLQACLSPVIYYQQAFLEHLSVRSCLPSWLLLRLCHVWGFMNKCATSYLTEGDVFGLLSKK